MISRRHEGGARMGRRWLGVSRALVLSAADAVSADAAEG
jgi:hypothetical protein